MTASVNPFGPNNPVVNNNQANTPFSNNVPNKGNIPTNGVRANNSGNFAAQARNARVSALNGRKSSLVSEKASATTQLSSMDSDMQSAEASYSENEAIYSQSLEIEVKAATQKNVYLNFAKEIGNKAVENEAKGDTAAAARQRRAVTKWENRAQEWEAKETEARQAKQNAETAKKEAKEKQIEIEGRKASLESRLSQLDQEIAEVDEQISKLTETKPEEETPKKENNFEDNSIEENKKKFVEKIQEIKSNSSSATQLKEEIKDLQGQLNTAQANEDAVAKELNTAKSRLAQLEKEEKMLAEDDDDGVSQSVLDQEKKIQGYDSQEGTRELIATEKEKEAEEDAAIEERKEGISDEINAAKQEVERLQSKLKAAGKSVRNISADLDAKTSDIGQLESKLSELQGEAKDLLTTIYKQDAEQKAEAQKKEVMLKKTQEMKKELEESIEAGQGVLDARAALAAEGKKDYDDLVQPIDDFMSSVGNGDVGGAFNSFSGAFGSAFEMATSPFESADKLNHYSIDQNITDNAEATQTSRKFALKQVNEVEQELKNGTITAEEARERLSSISTDQSIDFSGANAEIKRISKNLENTDMVLASAEYGLHAADVVAGTVADFVPYGTVVYEGSKFAGTLAGDAAFTDKSFGESASGAGTDLLLGAIPIPGLNKIDNVVPKSAKKQAGGFIQNFVSEQSKKSLKDVTRKEFAETFVENSMKKLRELGAKELPNFKEKTIDQFMPPS